MRCVVHAAGSRLSVRVGAPSSGSNVLCTATLLGVTSPTPPRRRATWDIVLTIIFMVLAILTSFIGLFAQLFILAFTDDCPPSTCHIDQGVASVGVTWFIVGIVVLLSIVFGIVLLVRRRRAWWVALIGLFTSIVGAIVGFVLYLSAVGGLS
jgi:uncharacterized BrkB/YihY/UPF0761 family membrane protein